MDTHFKVHRAEITSHKCTVHEKIAKLCTYFQMRCLRAHLRESFHPRMTFVLGWIHLSNLVVLLLLFTRFHPGITSSWDDFIPVLSTGMKCHPRMKRGKTFHVNGLPGMRPGLLLKLTALSICQNWLARLVLLKEWLIHKSFKMAERENGMCHFEQIKSQNSIKRLTERILFHALVATNTHL